MSPNRPSSLGFPPASLTSASPTPFLSSHFSGPPPLVMYPGEEEFSNLGDQIPFSHLSKILSWLVGSTLPLPLQASKQVPIGPICMNKLPQTPFIQTSSHRPHSYKPHISPFSITITKDLNQQLIKRSVLS